MKNLAILRHYGLFDAKVPRYTSYPPANRFELDVGRKRQRDWLECTPPDKPISIYVHIPFCKRLCWFCACHTQGTQTLNPIESYIEMLVKEIETVGHILPKQRSMARLLSFWIYAKCGGDLCLSKPSRKPRPSRA